MLEKGAVIGFIQKIKSDGKHGPYAIAKVEGLGSVTFSLEKGVWDEEDVPTPGDVVILSKLRRRRAGWRALCARYVQPSDTDGDSKTEKQERSAQ